jgi:hypothetical protein
MSDALQTRFGDIGMYGAGAAPAIGASYAVEHVGGYAIGAVYRAQEPATITHLGFLVNARAGTPPTYRISLQSVSSTTAFPTGTVLGGGTPASGTFTPPADTTWNNTFQWVALSNAYTCTRGQLFAIVIEHSSGTINGSNYTTFSPNYNINLDVATTGFPYVVAAAAAGPATWSIHTAFRPTFAYKSASRVYERPVETISVLGYSSDSSPDEYAMTFTIPSGWCTSYTVAGVRIDMQSPANGKTILVNLYSGTTVLQTCTWDTDNQRGAGESGRLFEFWFQDTTLTALTPGTQYRIGFQPQDTGTTIGWYYATVGSNNNLSGWPGGAGCYQSSRTNAGAWTDSDSTRPWVELILGDITSTGGGGGGEVAYPFA